MSRASRLDTYLRDHTRTYPHAKTVAYRPQHPRRLRFHLAPQRLQPGRRCAEACGGRAATGRTEHGCTEHPAMPQRPVRGDRPGRQAARAVRQRLRQYRRQRLPGHPDGGARGALEPDPGEGRQGVARRYRRSPVAAHPNLYGFVRDGKYGVVDGQGKKSRRRVSTTSTPTVPTNSSSTRSMASAASSMPRASSSPRRSTTPPWSTAASPNTAA